MCPGLKRCIKMLDATSLSLMIRVVEIAYPYPVMSTQTVTAVGQAIEPQAPVDRGPIQLKGTLDQYKSFDVTPIIGREYADVNLKDWLRAPNSDELIRDLAITSRRPARYFPRRDVLTSYSFAAWSCVLSKAGRPQQRAPEGISPTSWRIVRKARNLQAPYSSRQQLRPSLRRKRRRD